MSGKSRKIAVCGLLGALALVLTLLEAVSYTHLTLPTIA